MLLLEVLEGGVQDVEGDELLGWLHLGQLVAVVHDLLGAERIEWDLLTSQEWRTF